MAKEVKTNAMRMLDRAKISYEALTYQIDDEEFSGEAVAKLVGIEPERAFKTLVARGEKRGIIVLVVPVCREVDLKAAAAAAGDKRVELTHTKELLGLTGYIRGGVSPIGMKKTFRTIIDETAQLYDTIFVSAGRVGYQVQVSPAALLELVQAEYYDLIDMEHSAK